ncbi:alcohol dehydrogenase catalytic domain-containing protein [Streptomyces griseoluteus]|uniref:alcohol dehydrogenase catalytic domain-containing protein n=1 Tax=Streptomyces griseoluteus TaxID=29306 RepID=UPI003809FB2A
MRSVVYERFGEPSDVLEVRDTPDLQPPGPGEVLIRVHARPAHPGDLAGVRGRYAGGQQLAEPATPGLEGMGTIEALGPGLATKADLAVGGRVAFFPAPGAWADQVVVPAQFVVPVPNAVPNGVASQLLVKPITAVMLLRAAEEAGLGSGNGVLLHTAAASGVGRLLTALATSRGYTSVSVVRSAAGAAALRQEFDVPVVSTEESDWGARVRTAVGERPVQIICDPIGGAMSALLTDLLVDGGSLLAYGGLAEGEPMALDAMTLTSRALTVRGVTIGRWLTETPAAVREQDIAEAMRLALERPELFGVAAQYDLAEVKDAVRYMERPGKAGTVLLTSSPA